MLRHQLLYLNTCSSSSSSSSTRSTQEVVAAYSCMGPNACKEDVTDNSQKVQHTNDATPAKPRISNFLQETDF
jgi:hypothetical protein